MAFDRRRTLTPFVAKVLAGGPARRHKRGGEPVPLGVWRDAYAEDFAEIREVLGQGVLHALARQAGGWQRREVLMGGAASDAVGRRVRCWQACEDLGLHYSEASLRTCEALYNFGLRSTTADRAAVTHYSEATAALESLDPLESGDALVMYWMVVGLFGDLHAHGHPGRAHRARAVAAALKQSPLLRLRFGPVVGSTTARTITVEEVLESPLRAPSPWLVNHALGYWRELTPQLWKRRSDEIVSVRQTQRALLERWGEAIEQTGWFHLAIPFVEFFAGELAELGTGDAERKAAQAVIRLDEALASERQEVRYEVRAAWASMLGSARRLGDLHRHVQRIHPADREANHRWFSDWWARSGAGSTVTETTAVARRIEGRLG